MSKTRIVWDAATSTWHFHAGGRGGLVPLERGRQSLETPDDALKQALLSTWPALGPEVDIQRPEPPAPANPEPQNESQLPQTEPEATEAVDR